MEIQKKLKRLHLLIHPWHCTGSRIILHIHVQNLRDDVGTDFHLR